MTCGPASFVAWPPIHRDDVFASVSTTALRSLISIEKKPRAVEFKRFRREIGDAVGKRTAWEEVGRRMLESEQLSVAAFRTLMQAANESYQYAWGCMLSAAYPEKAGIQTRLPHLLGDST